MRIIASILAAALLALGLSACGGGSDSAPAPASASSQDVAQIEAIASRFAAAVDHRDTRAFCKLLAPSAKQRLGGAGRCLVVWGRRRNPLFAAKHPDLGLAKIVSLKIPDATVKLANGGRLVFVQEGGTWYVDLAPAKK